MKEKIKNPQRTVLRRWLFIDVIFIMLGINSYLNFDINSFDGMVLMLGITIVLTSLIFIKSTFKNIKLLDDAIDNGRLIVHWRYTKEEWSQYINNEVVYRSDEGKLIAYCLTGITLLIFIPFIFIVNEGKFAMFLVMLMLIVLYFFMGFILPRVMFYFRKRRTGEVILLKKGVLLDKQFHTWDFLLSKFKSATFKETPYLHLEISYDFIDRTGPRNYILNIPIPKNNKMNIKEIIAQFK